MRQLIWLLPYWKPHFGSKTAKNTATDAAVAVSKTALCTYLENNATNISITHTDKYVAVIINDNDEVGIDCESLDRDFSAVEKKALSEDEIDDLDDEKRNEQLAIYWCAKEAVYKKLSQYNVDFAEQIEISEFRMRTEGELEATFINKDGYEEELELQYITFDRHVLVWVVA